MTGSSTAPQTNDERVREITDAAALSRVINDSRPALVLFDAPWCPPARRIEQRLLRLSHGDLTVVRVDVDRAPELARKFAIRAVPTLAAFRAGQLAAKRLGDIADADLLDWLEHECLMPCA